jgi:hypothetical protein
MRKIGILLIALMVISVGLLSGCTNEETSEEISITSFGVEPRQIQQGETANLTWVTVGATSVTIDNGIGSVSLTGIRIIMPTANTTYTLTASDGKTTKTATTQIIVGGEQVVDGEEQAPTIGMHQVAAAVNDWVTFAVDSASADAEWIDLIVQIGPLSYGVPTATSDPAVGHCGYTGSGTPIKAGGELYVHGTTVIPGYELKVIHIPSNSVIVTTTIY